MENHGKCGCPHHKMTGVFVILFGLTFLLKNLEVISGQIAGIAWPVIIMIAGGTKLMSSSCKCCDKS